MPGTPVSAWPGLAPTCCLSPPGGDSDGCAFGRWQLFSKPVTSSRQVHVCSGARRATEEQVLFVRSSTPGQGSWLTPRRGSGSVTAGAPAPGLPAVEEGSADVMMPGEAAGPRPRELLPGPHVPAAPASPPHAAPARKATRRPTLRRHRDAGHAGGIWLPLTLLSEAQSSRCSPDPSAPGHSGHRPGRGLPSAPVGGTAAP